MLMADDTGLRRIDFVNGKKSSSTRSALARECGVPWRNCSSATGLLRRRTGNLRPPARASGNPFQLAVWNRLCEIPYGETISYGELARRVGNPNASRAVGLANGSNPIPIVIPCHRVIGSNGKLTGYGGGLPIKEKLLALERRQLRLL